MSERGELEGVGRRRSKAERVAFGVMGYGRGIGGTPGGKAGDIGRMGKQRWRANLYE